MGKLMVFFVNYHTNATRIGWHVWDIDLGFATGLPPGWLKRKEPGRTKMVSPNRLRQR